MGSAMGRSLTTSVAVVLFAVASGIAVAGDPEAGAVIYKRCIGCHAVDYNRTGPKHRGVVGRRAGSVEGYAYSSAMRDSGIVWTIDALDRFLASPQTVVPGTKMTYAGIADQRERTDLIAYLATLTESSESPDK